MSFDIIEILQFIASLFGVAIVFGITVFVHELGHFLAARYKGLHVERFAIGFGPKICSFKRDGVEYAICWIPFGGYVALPQMAPMEMVEGESDVEVKDLPPISPWAKIVTAFWGPAFSLLLALACASLLFFVGKNENSYMKTTVIGFVEKDSPAAEAGLLPGDRILSINGKTVFHWSKNGKGAVRQSIIFSAGQAVRIQVEREGQKLDFDIKPVLDPDLENLRALGFEDYNAKPLIVGKFFTESTPAEKAGLKVDDQIVSANGQHLYSPAQMASIIEESDGEIELGILREGQELSLMVLPEVETKTGDKMIGVRWAKDKIVQTKWISPITQVSDSVITMGMTISALVNPQSDISPKHMSGPVGIFDLIRQLINNPRALIAFCVFFNVNLAVLNLLPLPILDGGHITFAIIEWITNRPVHVKVLYALQTSFFIILIAFMLFVSFHDVGRISKTQKKKAESEKLAEELEDMSFETAPAKTE
ncbi:MAG: RIP metalloprotease RseP [Verrucomicrobiota bacterium]